MAASNQQLTAVEQKHTALVTAVQADDFTAKLRSLLGPTVPVARFQEVVSIATQSNPNLLLANRESLLTACLQAAKSKLLPDGKQGALVMYGKDVQWQVMIAGLRTILARSGFDLRTEVVYENDEFDYDLGDEPHITHKRPKLGQKRGAMIGVYAIARGPDGRLYRRVMDKEEVDFIKSKAKTGNVWATWYNAMAEKTVGRALVKQLPIYDESEELKEAIETDNATFNLDAPSATRAPSAAAAAVAAAAAGKPAPEPAPIDGEFTDVTGTPEGEPEQAPVEEDPLGGAGAPGDDIEF